ncbi:unannotated protein [freshwater metagenome]|uniref:Unannotated protein n=1 Tax=freshwater metagenome TaxID=449393 RepID=A0A6J7VDS9_9ZZZZ
MTVAFFWPASCPTTEVFKSRLTESPEATPENTNVKSRVPVELAMADVSVPST